MKTIKISVRDKIAVNMSNIPYTCGNSDFVINFDFDAEWDEFSVKTARFIKDDRTYQNQVFQGNKCPIPVLYNTNKIRVGVFAGNLHTSTPAIITANKSILCVGGSPEAPSEDVYAQIMEMLNNSGGSGGGGDGGSGGGGVVVVRDTGDDTANYSAEEIEGFFRNGNEVVFEQPDGKGSLVYYLQFIDPGTVVFETYLGTGETDVIWRHVYVQSDKRILYGEIREPIIRKTSQLKNDSGFIAGPATAAVGQTIVVSEVDKDGKPTRWEARDAGAGGGVLETVKSNNLLDTGNIVTSYVDGNGATVTGSFTNWIKVKNGQRYVTNITYTQFILFDENKNFVSSSTQIVQPVIITGNGGYLLIKCSDFTDKYVLEGTDIGAYKAEHTKLRAEDDNNKWYGKRWLCIGDSISTDEADLADVGYAKLISRELGMVLTNISQSGKTMAWGYEQVDGCSGEFDLITVMLGTNNHGYNSAIGELNDSYYAGGAYNSNSSFFASTQLMYEKLKAKYPKSVIMFITPIKRTAPDGTNDSTGYMINAHGFTTEKYAEAIRKACDYYSIPCVDVFNTIDPRTEENRNLFFMSASDGTHPNDLGHALFIAPVVKDYIVKHAPYFFNEWTDSDDDEEGDTNGGGTDDGGDTGGGNEGSGDNTGGGDDSGNTGESTEPVLLHSYTSTLNDSGVLEDSTGSFDLTQSKGNCRGETRNEHLALNDGDSFTIKVTNAGRKAVYFSQGFGLHTGSYKAGDTFGTYHVNENPGIPVTGRLMFECGPAEGNTNVFGDAVPYIKYIHDDNSDGVNDYRYVYSNVVFKKDETHSFVITFDKATNAVKVYMDGEIIIDHIMTLPVRVDGLCLKDIDSGPFERLEVYRGVLNATD